MPYVRLYNLIFLKRDILFLKEKINLDNKIENKFHNKICNLYSLSLLFEILCSLFSIFLVNELNIDFSEDTQTVLIRSNKFYNSIRKLLKVNGIISLIELNKIRNIISHSISTLVNKNYEEVIRDIDYNNLKEIIKRSLELVNTSKECYILLDCVDELFLVEQNNNPIEKLFIQQNEIYK